MDPILRSVSLVSFYLKEQVEEGNVDEEGG
jgi:hypothetical protein